MAQDNNLPRPIIFLTDAISGSSGLARIGRDIATQTHENLSDIYRVGTAGYGAAGSRKFGFPQYNLQMEDWVCMNLPDIVEDFAGNERCIIFPIFDLHRLRWFSQPERLGGESLAKYPELKRWLLSANIAKWAYVPIDSSGPNDRLSLPIALTALGFDRLLAYGKFGEGVIRRSIGDDEADKRHLTNLPHGINCNVFYEMPRFMSRNLFFQHTGAQTMLAMFGVNPEIKPIGADEVLIGCVCTNQPRKDIALACETIAILSRLKKTRFWLHTDRLEGAWSIPTLLADYGIMENSVISLGYIHDSKMASAYSACDVTIGPGSEGWGFPLGESLACHTPVIHGSYAGGADIVPKEMQVDPVAFRYEGSFASKRPVYRAEDWARKVNEWVGKRAELNPRYNWTYLWANEWEPYLREAAE